MRHNDGKGDSSDSAILTMHEMAIRLERIRIQEALNARDTAVKRLGEACASIREKTEAMNALRSENEQLQHRIHKCKDTKDTKDVDQENEFEFHRKGEMAEGDKDTSLMKLTVDDAQPRSMSGMGKGMIISVDKDSVKSASEPTILRDSSHINVPIIMPTSYSPLSSSATTAVDAPDFPWTPLEGERKATLPSVSTAEKIEARYAVLASLPIPSGIPEDSLTPILVPHPFTLHDFIGTTSGLLRTQLGHYRVFQQSTTTWCPEREEHGYFLTPFFKCTTNPRVNTAHTWSVADITVNLDRPTECFFNKDGNWYYAGIYKSFRLDDLCPQEWECLSTETSQSLIKETLAGRKNISPQNVYEIGQLYSVGALKVACIGLQCIGFNNALYRGLLEHAALCTQANKWRAPAAGFNVNTGLGLGSGATWNAATPAEPVSPGTPTGGVGVIGRPGRILAQSPTPTPTLRLLQLGTPELSVASADRT